MSDATPRSFAEFLARPNAQQNNQQPNININSIGDSSCQINQYFENLFNSESSKDSSSQPHCKSPHDFRKDRREDPGAGAGVASTDFGISA